MVFVISLSNSRTIKKIIPFKTMIHVVLGKIVVKAMCAVWICLISALYLEVVSAHGVIDANDRN